MADLSIRPDIKTQFKSPFMCRIWDNEKHEWFSAGEGKDKWPYYDFDLICGETVYMFKWPLHQSLWGGRLEADLSTGVLDCKGRMIYEHDLVRLHELENDNPNSSDGYVIGEIRFMKGRFLAVLDEKLGEFPHIVDMCDFNNPEEDWEVIGDVHK